MPKKFRELLFQIGLVLGAIVLGKALDFSLGYVAAAILTIAFIIQWLLQRDEERDNELSGLFGGQIPWASLSSQTFSKASILEVEVAPTRGKAEDMYLEVTNLGEKQTFHAQCRILRRRNDDNSRRLITLDLHWKRNNSRELEIHRGETCGLHVAHAGQDRNRDIEWMEIVGSPEIVQSQWGIGQISPLPEYDVEIVIFGSGNQKPYSETFNIRAGRECALEMYSLATSKRPEIRVYVEELALGLRKLWFDKTFLFMFCHIVSMHKATSVLGIRPTISTKDGSRLKCVLMDSLEAWSYEPEGSRMDLEVLSLWKKLREKPLAEEVKESGWLGIEIPLNPQKTIDDLSSVELCVIDAGERTHPSSFKPPWPVNEQHLIVAKHVRQL